MVHWRREWQTNPAFLPWEPHEQYEKAKRYDMRHELPRLVGAQCAPGEEWRNSSNRDEEAEPKWKQHPAGAVSSGESKVWCWKEQYCIVTWNVRSMSQGKLEVVKRDGKGEHRHFRNQEVKWTWTGEFNSGEHYIYYCGQESLRRNGVALIVNKSLKCSTWVQSQKWQNDLWLFPRQTIQYHSYPSLCPNQ